MKQDAWWACAPTTKAWTRAASRRATSSPATICAPKWSFSPKATRGSLTKQLIGRFQLDQARNPQTYGVGVKELWEVPSGRIARRRSHLHHGLSADLPRVRRRLDLRLQRQHCLARVRHRPRLSAIPRLDPQHVLQEFKKHPFIAKLLEGGKMIRYGAKSLPYGGWWCIPPVRRRRLADPWRLGRFPEFAAAEGNSPRHQERHARRRDRLRRDGEETTSRSPFWRSIRTASTTAGSRPSSGRCATFTRDSRTDSCPACFTPAFSSSPADAACTSATPIMPAIVACGTWQPFRRMAARKPTSSALPKATAS